MSNFSSIWTSILSGVDENVGKKIENGFNEIFGEGGSLNQPKPKPKGVYAVDAKKTKTEPIHTHPAERDSRVEPRPAYVGSLGDVKDEGCETHADVRYISTAQNLNQTNDKSKIKEYIIFSEILGKPKCKR